MSFSQWVTEHSDDDRDELAKVALEEVPDLVLWVVRREIDHVRRLVVRAVESGSSILATMRLATEDANSIPGPGISPEGFLGLMRQRFALGDGTFATWGDATVTQHEQRLVMLRAMAVGVAATIRRHEVAIERLRETGAACLDEIVRAGEFATP